jgi:dephospho-CoA kinase
MGGIACGKSLVAATLERLGAVLIDADKCVTQLYEQATFRQAVVGALGREVLASNGALDRAAIARLVFAEGHEALLRQLEALVHPAVAREIERALTAAHAMSPAPELVVLDVPLLAEAPSLLALCDRCVFVDSDEMERERRCQQLRGWPAGERERRERLQRPLDEKRALCRHFVRNSGSVADMEVAARELHSGVLAAHRLAMEIALRGPRAHSGQGPEARARDGARRAGS